MKKRKFDSLNLISYVILTLGLLVVIIPMYFMLISSLKDNSLTFSYPPELFPPLNKLSFKNYQYVLKNSPFSIYLINTIFVAFMTVLISTITSTTLAYSFARLYIPGKKYIFAFVLSIMMVPGLALIVPQFELAVTFRLVNNLW